MAGLRYTACGFTGARLAHQTGAARVGQPHSFINTFVRTEPVGEAAGDQLDRQPADALEQRQDAIVQYSVTVG